MFPQTFSNQEDDPQPESKRISASRVRQKLIARSLAVSVKQGVSGFEKDVLIIMFFSRLLCFLVFNDFF